MVVVHRCCISCHLCAERASTAHHRGHARRVFRHLFLALAVSPFAQRYGKNRPFHRQEFSCPVAFLTHVYGAFQAVSVLFVVRADRNAFHVGGFAVYSSWQFHRCLYLTKVAGITVCVWTIKDYQVTTHPFAFLRACCQSFNFFLMMVKPSRMGKITFSTRASCAMKSLKWTIPCVCASC